MPESLQDASLHHGHRSLIAGFADPEFDSRIVQSGAEKVQLLLVVLGSLSLLGEYRSQKVELRKRTDIRQRLPAKAVFGRNNQAERKHAKRKTCKKWRRSGGLENLSVLLLSFLLD